MKLDWKQYERLVNHGYRMIHLFGNWYLCRNFSIHAKQFSLYGLVHVKEN